MASDAAIVARWKTLLKIREGLLATARAREAYRSRRYHKLVEQEGSKPASPARSRAYRLLKDRKAAVAKREGQVADARKVIARHSKAAPGRMSPAGIAFLRREEGCVLHPYNDSAGHATIGVGHLIHHGGVTPADRARYAGFTQRDADQLLATDLRRYEDAVTAAIRGAKVSQHAFDAMTSLSFNIGTGGFAGLTVAAQVRMGNKRAAADAFLNWAHPPELRGRRERERALFLK